MSEWISVKDRLPEIEQTVIVMQNFKENDHLKYNPYVMAEDVSGGIYWSDKEFYLDHPTSDFPCVLENVTHWMPLPEPPSND